MRQYALLLWYLGTLLGTSEPLDKGVNNINSNILLKMSELKMSAMFQAMKYSHTTVITANYFFLFVFPPTRNSATLPVTQPTASMPVSGMKQSRQGCSIPSNCDSITRLSRSFSSSSKTRSLPQSATKTQPRSSTFKCRGQCRWCWYLPAVLP